MRFPRLRELTKAHALLAAVAAAVMFVFASTMPSAADNDQIERLIGRLYDNSIVLVRSDGTEIATRRRSAKTVERITESDVVAALGGMQLSRTQAASLWTFFADVDNASLLTVPIVKALIAASATPGGHDAMWSELGGFVEGEKRDRSAGATLLSFFTRHRQTLLPLVGGVRETEGAGNAMVDIMANSRLFGDDIDASVQWVGARHPAALARRIERERERGRPVAWEYAGFDQLVKWKDRHYGPKATESPRSQEAQISDGETFVVMFNSLHGLDEWFRRQMLASLTPLDVFAIVVGGETQLYALGTSGYRNYLHAIIMRGVADSGSYEGFLQKASSTPFGELPHEEMGRRRMVFLRIASAFGLLGPVLATVKDRARFIDDIVHSLADLAALESNASVVLDILDSRSRDAASVKFRAELLERLYALYAAEPDPKRRSIFGSVLSVYQNQSGDVREPEIDRLYPLDRSLMQSSFDALFSPSRDGGHVHRMFMRLDDDVDASSNHAGFRALMIARGASIHSTETYEAYRIRKSNRTIEIYLNRPNAAGLKKGLDELARILDGAAIHTVVGRGHTGIITPLRNDATRLFGARRNQVATVILGTCGGSASTRELIETFGYRTFISTRATGRQLINNAIIDRYVTMLLAMSPGDTLAIGDVLSKAVAPFLTADDEDLREDAKFYHVNAANVYAAMLFDRYVHATGLRSAAQPVPLAAGEPASLSWREATSRDQLFAPRSERGRTSNARNNAEPQEPRSATFPIEFPQ